MTWVKLSRGFTLIEVVIVVALTGIIMVVLTEFFFTTNQIYKSQNAELGVNMSARASLDDIDAYVKQATQVVDTYSTYSTGPTALILEIQSIDGSGQLIPGVYDKVVYYMTGNSLFREIFPDPASSRLPGGKLLGRYISTLEFTYDNASMPQVSVVTINMTIAESAGRETRDITISSKSRLRN
jgi:prepilin-type N-terminal cleavage/methylation domain-containing protein